ncbi:unnamed protein product [Closterium sp. NIES-54]
MSNNSPAGCSDGGGESDADSSTENSRTLRLRRSRRIRAWMVISSSEYRPAAPAVDAGRMLSRCNARAWAARKEALNNADTINSNGSGGSLRLLGAAPVLLAMLEMQNRKRALHETLPRSLLQRASSLVVLVCLFAFAPSLTLCQKIDSTSSFADLAEGSISPPVPSSIPDSSAPSSAPYADIDGLAADSSNTASNGVDNSEYWSPAPASLPATSDNASAEKTGDLGSAPAPSYTGSESSGSLSSGAIVATVLGVVFGVFMLVVVIWVAVVRAKNHERARAVSRGNFGDVDL